MSWTTSRVPCTALKAREQALAAAESIVEFHPAALEAYRRKVSELQLVQSDEGEVTQRGLSAR
jgi:hypothetical protein